MRKFRAIVSKYLPRFVTNKIRGYRRNIRDKHFSDRNPKDIFTEIYDKSLWGMAGNKDKFYSGTGSHDERVVNGYISAVSAFLGGFDKPSVADLGCGDFSVGSKIRPYCGTYIAGDIVDSLVQRNRAKWADLNVDFRVVDLIRDDLPSAQILFVRQVLQHLSNDAVAAVLAKISGHYDYFVLTEHVPIGDFPPNLDKVSGPDIRASCAPPSGVVATEAPFDLSIESQEILCEVREDSNDIPATIRTIAYKLKRS